jgi:hypothetical protein
MERAWEPDDGVRIGDDGLGILPEAEYTLLVRGENRYLLLISQRRR